MRTVDIEVGDVVFELECTRFWGGSPGGYWDPPEDGECEVGNFVRFWVNGSKHAHVTTYNVFLLDFAVMSDLSLDDADRAVYHIVFQNVQQQIADDYESARESRYEV
jgi:hypothetical protein